MESTQSLSRQCKTHRRPSTFIPRSWFLRRWRECVRGVGTAKGREQSGRRWSGFAKAPRIKPIIDKGHTEFLGARPEGLTAVRHHWAGGASPAFAEFGPREPC